MVGYMVGRWSVADLFFSLMAGVKNRVCLVSYFQTRV